MRRRNRQVIAGDTASDLAQIMAYCQQILATVNQANGKATVIMAAQDDINAAAQRIENVQQAMVGAVASISAAVADIKAWEAAHSAVVDTSGLLSAVSDLEGAGASLSTEVADVQSADLQPPAGP